jgi:hypothetical protein
VVDVASTVIAPSSNSRTSNGKPLGPTAAPAPAPASAPAPSPAIRRADEADRADHHHHESEVEGGDDSVGLEEEDIQDLLMLLSSAGGVGPGNGAIGPSSTAAGAGGRHYLYTPEAQAAMEARVASIVAAAEEFRPQGEARSRLID